MCDVSVQKASVRTADAVTPTSRLLHRGLERAAALGWPGVGRAESNGKARVLRMSPHRRAIGHV